MTKRILKRLSLLFTIILIMQPALLYGMEMEEIVPGEAEAVNTEVDEIVDLNNQENINTNEEPTIFPEQDTDETQLSDDQAIDDEVSLHQPFHTYGDWDGSTLVPSQDEDGVYQIGQASELAGFAEIVNKGKEHEKINGVLTADIDLNHIEWTPIGNYAGGQPAYGGVFDGRGYTISGLYISSARGYQGIFGLVEGTVRNIKIEGSVSSSQKYIGAVAGVNEGVIDNCHNYAALTGRTNNGSQIGGIVGSNTGKVLNCANYGSVSIHTTTAVQAGGIAGYNEGLIIACENMGDISGNNRIGGISGELAGGMLAGCYNGGTVSANNVSAMAGGLTGLINEGEIAHCYNIGRVSVSGSSARAGGLVGNMGSQAVMTMLNCYNAGVVTGNTTAPLFNKPTNDSGITAVSVNNYYLAENNGNSQEVTDAQLRAAGFEADLNKGSVGSITVDDRWDYVYRSQGYPALRWQNVLQDETVPVATIVIKGTPQVGEVLMLTVTGEGGKTPTGPLTYQWQAGAQGRFNTIANASRDSYCIAPEYAGMQIKASVSGALSITKTATTDIIKPSADWQAVEEDWQALEIPELVDDTVVDDTITLKNKGENGSLIEWESSDEHFIDKEGNVNPPSSGSVQITMTATIKKGDQVKRKTFVITVHSKKPVSTKNSSSQSVSGQGALLSQKDVEALPAIAHQTTNGELGGDALLFRDVPPSHWAYPAILSLVNQGVFTGVSEDAFELDSPLSRAQFVTLLARMSEDELPVYNHYFNDVDKAHWYSPYVAWGCESGVIIGVGGGNFAPLRQINFAELSVILMRYAQYMGVDLTETKELPPAKRQLLLESGCPEYAQSAVAALWDLEILPRSYELLADVSRADAALLLYNFNRKIGQGGLTD